MCNINSHYIKLFHVLLASIYCLLLLFIDCYHVLLLMYSYIPLLPLVIVNYNYKWAIVFEKPATSCAGVATSARRAIVCDSSSYCYRDGLISSTKDSTPRWHSPPRRYSLPRGTYFSSLEGRLFSSRSRSLS